MSEDIKQVVSEFGQAFEEFKKANDQKLEALENQRAGRTTRDSHEKTELWL